jgi:alkylhydroperoxidase family enzyme
MVRVRQEFSLSLEYRELIMLRVAWLNKAEFEWNVHYPAYLDAGGTAEKATALRLSSAPHCLMTPKRCSSDLRTSPRG